MKTDLGELCRKIHMAKTSFIYPLEKEGKSGGPKIPTNNSTYIITARVMLSRIKPYIIVQILQIICNMDTTDIKYHLQFTSHTYRNKGESKLLWFCGTFIKNKQNSVLSFDQRAGWRRTISVVHQPRRAQRESCSEWGEARHFDIDVSNVDVAGNLGQVHVLHSRDSTSWSR